MSRVARIGRSILEETIFGYVCKEAHFLLDEFNCPPPPIDLHHICNVKKWRVSYEDTEIEGASTIIPVKNKLVPIIRLANNVKFTFNYSHHTKERRKNITLAHEMGHVILHDKAFASGTELSENAKELCEQEAGYFALSILMPNYVFETKDDLVPELLAEKCNVNIKAARSRLYNLDMRVINRIYRQHDVNKPLKSSKRGFYIPDFVHRKGSIKVETLRHHEVDVDENNRYLFCPNCNTNDFSEHAKYCYACGYYLFNKCETVFDDDPFSPNYCTGQPSGKARYCEICGEQTKLYKDGHLTSPEEYAEWKRQQANLLLDIDDSDLPF